MQINKNTTFVIWSYDFDWRVGGIYALHFLAKKVADRGYRVFCICNRTIPHSNVKMVTMKHAEEIAKRKNTVTIYPEIVPGNPLGATHPVRWVMYYPGGHGMGDKVYAENECIVTYHDIFVVGTPYEGCPLVHIRDSKSKSFFDMGLKDRPNNIVLVKKGAKGGDMQSVQDRSDKYISPYAEKLGIGEFMMLDRILPQVQTMDALNEIYNGAKYFVSFDVETYHSVLAAMAGCISVIIPQDGLTKEQLFEKLPDWKYGIAYGFDDLDHARETQGLIHQYAKELELDNDASIDRLGLAIQEKFGLQ